MTTIRPTDLPRLRAAAIEDVGQYGVGRCRVGIARVAARPPRDLDAASRMLATWQLVALRECELFFVSEDMMQLARGAGISLTDIDLYPYDLPAPDGFLYFADPLQFDDGPDFAVRISAVSWHTRWAEEGERVDQALMLTWWVPGDELRRLTQAGLLNTDGLIIRDVNQFTFTAWRFGQQQTLLIDNVRRPITATKEGAGIATLFSAFHLMKQELVQVAPARYDRASIRRLKRDGVDDPPLVRVVTLRRRSLADGSDEEHREYRHQWVVRGHWRRQVCGPQRSERRMIWIAPHIKGPEDCPLLGGEKVYALKR